MRDHPAVGEAVELPWVLRGTSYYLDSTVTYTDTSGNGYSQTFADSGGGEAE